ncbi:MAG: glutamyl-tRNA reductase [Lacunisphaera sp.]
MNAGELFLIGATHRTAPLGVRERLALTDAAAAGLASDLAAMPGLREFVILNTCNRIEIYGVGANAGSRLRVTTAFCVRQGFALQEFERLRLELTGRAAVSHLLEVASGLDSQMLGENEIFGQVKRAYEAAQTRGSAGPVLNRIFQKTFQAAKHVRSHTAITAGLVSVASVAVELAASIFGDLGRARVLLLGAGEIGLKSGRAFRSRAPATLAVASRRLDRAQEVAAELEASALGFENAVAGLADFDVVVCSTAAPAAVISTTMVAAAMQRRGGRPLFFIDVALPRDVAPDVAGLGNVFVYNLDDLARIAAENRSARQAEIAKCQAILGEKADALWSQASRWLQPAEQRAAPTGALCPAAALCVAG